MRHSASTSGCTGIAITLATREDSEAVAGIEKLLGHKIARAGSADNEAEAATAPKEARAAKPREARRAKAEPRTAAPRSAEPALRSVSRYVRSGRRRRRACP